MNRLKTLITEAHRRSLWQVLLIYVGAGWLVFEIVQTVTEGLGLPQWFPAFAALLLLIGLPVVLATAFVREAEPRAAVSDPTLIPVDEARTAAARRRRFLTWRNASLIFMVALAVWGVVVTGWLLIVGSSTGDGRTAVFEVENARVAVFPFSFRGADDLAYLGEGMASLLAKALDGAGEIRTVDDRAVLGVVSLEIGGVPDTEQAREIAHRLGAGSFVIGDIVEIGGRLQINAAFYSPGTGPEGRKATAEGSAQEEFFRLVNALARDLLVGERGDPGARLTQLAAVTTDSLRALKAYLEGEAHSRGGRNPEATDAFRRAVAVDSAFALAWYRLAIAADWSGPIRLEREAAEQAVRYSDRLSSRERELLGAFLAWYRGAGFEAERRYRAIVRAYPTDVQAWEQLAEILHHYGPMKGRSMVESREAWERLLFLEPDNLGAHVHLVRLAAIERRHAELDSLVTRLAELTPESTLDDVPRAIRAFALGDSAALAEVVVERALGVTPERLPSSVARYVRDLPAAQNLFSQALASAQTTEERARGRWELAALELAQGRWRAARQELATVEELYPALGLELRALFTLSPYLDTPRADLEELYAEVDSWDPGAIRLDADYARFNGVHEQLRLYLLGMLSARLGQSTIAEEYAASLDEMPGPELTGSLTADMAVGVRALTAWELGEYEEALTILEAVRRERNYDVFGWSPFFSQGLERYLQAEILYELGRYDDALEWYRSAPEPYVSDLIYLAPSHLRRAEIYERQGNDQQALYHYGRFVELWKDADPELQPRVEAARRAIEVLSTDR